jgi:hypothetical protein
MAYNLTWHLLGLLTATQKSVIPERPTNAGEQEVTIIMIDAAPFPLSTS